MNTPNRNTIMRLAVASACSWIALSAQAQAQTQTQAQAQAQAQPQTQGAASAPVQMAAAGPEAQTAAGQQTAPTTPAADGTQAAASAPAAAPAPEAAAPVENVITVSGSRIAARGFTQPTPTTTLSADDLAKGAQPNIFNAIAELPALQGSTGRTTSTNSTRPES